MKKLIVFLVLIGVCYAGEYKSCIIKYKTDAGLCQHIEKILNVVDTVAVFDTVMWRMYIGEGAVTVFDNLEITDADAERWIEAEKRSKGYIKSKITPDTAFVWGEREYEIILTRQYRGLTVVSEPKWSMATFNYVLIDSAMIEPGKAILIWEEVIR